MMNVSLCNEGPVTIILDTRNNSVKSKSSSSTAGTGTNTPVPTAEEQQEKERLGKEKARKARERKAEATKKYEQAKWSLVDKQIKNDSTNTES